MSSTRYRLGCCQLTTRPLKLKTRTLTNLYNARPAWLEHLHAALDRAVFDAYGWKDEPTDEQILERLLALNLDRAATQDAEG